jgi:hypothetical protein
LSHCCHQRPVLLKFSDDRQACVDLNMVRSGVAADPAQRCDYGYVEIQYPQARNRIVDDEHLMKLMGVDGLVRLKQFGLILPNSREE